MPKTKLQGGIYVTMPDGLGGDTIQVTSLPAASASELGKIYQFVGTTTSDYTNGYFYECVSDGAATPTYSWTRKNVQPAGGSAVWGQIDGTLSDQTDLQSALDDKANKVSGTHTNELVTLDSGGNVQASGKTVADVTDIIYGYMHEGAFYEDSAYTTAITPTANKQYMDMTAPSTPAPYVYNGSAYVSIGGGDTSTLEEVAAEALTDLDYRLRKVINGHIKDGKEKILTDANFKPVNNLTTVVAVQPLSASQGKYLKDLSDTNEEILAWALTELALVKSAVNNIAREYSPSTAYNVDEYCIHDGLLFRCTTATSASVSFDPSKWTQTNVMDELIRLTSN